jgi:hypothetical protein
MKKFDVALLSKKLHLPITRGIIETKRLSFFKRVLRFFTFVRRFEIMKDYLLWYEDLKMYILLPASFIYDGASVPKILGTIYSSVGVLYVGSGPHDLGYRYGGLFLVDPESGEVSFKEMSKRELDLIFDNLCAEETGMRIASGLARNTLSFFGLFTWRSMRKKTNIPEKDFPSLYVEIKKEA